MTELEMAQRVSMVQQEDAERRNHSTRVGKGLVRMQLKVEVLETAHAKRGLCF